MALNKTNLQARLVCALLAAASPAWVMAQNTTPPGAPASSTNPADLFTAAEKAFVDKDYEAAAKLLLELFEIVKDNREAPLELLRFNIGLAHLLADKPAEAERAFRACLSQFPQGEYASRCQLGIGRALIAQAFSDSSSEKQKLEAAVEPLRIAAADPQYRSEAGLSLGQVYIDLGRNEEALTVFRSLMGSDVQSPQQTNAAVEVVGLLAESDRLDDLVSYLGRLINQPGVRNAIAWYTNQIIVRADQLTERQHFESALALYRSIPPRTQILQTQRRAIASQKEEIARLEKLVEAESKLPIGRRTNTASEQLANLKSAVELTTQALETIEEKTDLDAALLMRRGRCLYYLSRYEEALLCFRTIRTKYPEAADVQTAAYSEIFVYTQLKDTEQIQKLADEFLKKYPDSANLEQVALIVGDGLANANKWQEVLKFYRDLEAKFPDSQSLDRYTFYQGVALFQDGEFAEAASLFADFPNKFPDSPLLEDALYRIAMANFLTNQYKETLQACNTYLQRYPDGRYAGDIRYRLAFIDFNDKEEDQSDKIISGLGSYLEENPNDPAAGSMLSLIGDTYSRKKNDPGKALEFYKRAIWTDSAPDVIQYAIDSATSILQGNKDWAGVAALHGEILERMEGTRLALVSATWVARMNVREGKGEEAALLLSNSLRTTISDPTNEQVEFLIDELVKTLVPTNRKVLAETNLDELEEKMVSILNKASEGQENPTSNARTYYARARLAQLMRQPERADLYLKGIATTTPDPASLSPALLSVSGEILLKEGQFDQAEAMFQRLSDRFKESSFADAGPVGLGRVALARGEFEQAFSIFEETLDTNPGMSRYREATIGKLTAMVQLGQLDASEQLANEIIGDRQFRGSYVAEAYMLLSEVYRGYAANESGAARQESLKKAHAYYQRVYTAYRAFPEICAEAYWNAYEVLGELGETTIAAETLKQLADHPRLQGTERSKQAKALLP